MTSPLLYQPSDDTHLSVIINRDVEAVNFQPLPLPLTKNEKTTVDNFFTFVGL